MFLACIIDKQKLQTENTQNELAYFAAIIT